MNPNLDALKVLPSVTTGIRRYARCNDLPPSLPPALLPSLLASLFSYGCKSHLFTRCLTCTSAIGRVCGKAGGSRLNSLSLRPRGGVRERVTVAGPLGPNEEESLAPCCLGGVNARTVLTLRRRLLHDWLGVHGLATLQSNTNAPLRGATFRTSKCGWCTTVCTQFGTRGAMRAKDGHSRCVLIPRSRLWRWHCNQYLV